MRRTAVFYLCAVILAILPAGFALAAGTAVSEPLDRLQRADGVKVVPERFLRRWDPVTVFFDRDTGSASGGPEDTPDHYVIIAAAQPGAWGWLGPRVLQFRPADPWQPLGRIALTVVGSTTILVPLLPAPVET